MGDIRLRLKDCRESIGAFRTALAHTLEALREGFTVEDPTPSIETLERDIQRLSAGEGTVLATPKHLAAGIRLIRPDFEAVPISLTYKEFTVLWSTVEFLWPDFPGAEIITIATEHVLIPEFVPTVAGMGYRAHRVTPALWVVPRKVKAAYHPSPKYLVLRLVT